MAAIKHYLIVHSSPQKIYKALTTKTGVANWWTVQTEIGNKVGDTNIFDFGERYHNEMRIKDLRPQSRVEWLCEKGDREWREETDFFASCNYQWGYYLRSLKLYCESGKGTPFTGE